MAKDMVKISSCDVTECAYNKHNSCHTLAITVGGPQDICPQCDTYVNSSNQAGIQDMTGGVGACKVESCSYNDALECNASSIVVGKHMNHPDCKTFKARSSS
ncbi:MAG TPA: DUF1540 domain-containing protein [Desulfuromonadaceae bacterium]